MKRQLITLTVLAAFAATPALAADTTSTTSTTTSTTSANPAKVTNSSISAAVAALNFSSTCTGGGTRTSTGTWDSTTGALSLTSTNAACVGPNGESQDGTRTLSGTLLLDGTSAYTVDVTTQESLTVTRDGATKLQHSCTITRKGSFDGTTDRFTGTVTRTNCVDSGEVWDHEHGIESLLRPSQVIDVPQAPTGLNPPQKGMGNRGPGMNDKPGKPGLPGTTSSSTPTSSTSTTSTTSGN